MEENKKIIYQLSNIYDELNKLVDEIQELLNSSDYSKDELLTAYKKINIGRKEATKLLGKYIDNDDVVETKNIKTLRRGFLNIINITKASMLIENTYENQRSVNKLSLDTLIPLINFKIHHIPDMKEFTEEIFHFNCYFELEDLYSEQFNSFSSKLEKIKEAKLALEHDLENVNVLMDDLNINNTIYSILEKNNIIPENYDKLIIETSSDEKNISVQILENNNIVKEFHADIDNLEKIQNTKFKEIKATNLTISSEDIIAVEELQSLTENIKKNLEQLDTTTDLLSKKIIQLNKDKEELDSIKDDFFKNGTGDEEKEDAQLKLSAE